MVETALLILVGLTLALQLLLLLRAGRGEQQELATRLLALEQQVRLFNDTTRDGFEASRRLLDEKLTQGQAGAAEHRREVAETLALFRQELTSTLAALRQDIINQLGGLSQAARQDAEQLRGALNERLTALQADNASKLEEMRRTVDEKLHATLEQRLGESFKLVSERLEQVHAGLGEMKSLAGSVGDLKRVMTNVRSRGTWGEVQLGAILESLLTAEQYAQNVKTVPGSNELVEYAIRMPGPTDTHPVWLPMDAKYPVEHYQRLLDAHEALDKALVLQAGNAFESSLKAEARKIASKYLSPPHTTDFAIMFLPTEGLFAAVCRLPGVVPALQTKHRTLVAGPTTLAAMLNSLRLGFRTLAIEKRSSEVWNLLSAVKTEFRKFGDIVDATHKSIDAAARKFSDIGVRTRAIERKLKGVEELPAAQADALLGDESSKADDDG